MSGLVFSVRLGRWFHFDVDARGGLFVRLPLIGQAYLCRGLSACDTWAALRRCREV